MARGLLPRLLIALLIGGCDPDPYSTAMDVIAPDAVDVTSLPDVPAIDVGQRDAADVTSSPDVLVTARDSGGDGASGGRVRSCDEVSRFFNCEGDLHSCFQINPSGDQGACDSPGQFCENWWNCGAPGNRRAVDWDCYCDGSGDGARWRCRVRATCASRRDGGA